jgi:hypothetical protein
MLTGDLEAACSLLQAGVAKYPDFDKLWIMLVQIKETQARPHRMRSVC